MDLLQSTLEITSLFTDASCPRYFLLYASPQIKSTTRDVCFVVFRCSSRLDSL